MASEAEVPHHQAHPAVHRHQAHPAAPHRQAQVQVPRLLLAVEAEAEVAMKTATEMGVL